MPSISPNSFAKLALVRRDDRVLALEPLGLAELA